jgi:hypothetical protein
MCSQWLMSSKSENQVRNWIVLSNPTLGSNILFGDTKIEIWDILGTMVRSPSRTCDAY